MEMDEGRNGTGKHHQPIPATPSWIERLSQRAKSDPPHEKFRKKLEWYKWLLGGVVGIFVAGGAAMVYVQGFATDEEVSSAMRSSREMHERTHNGLEKRLSSIEEQVTSTRISQAVHEERSKLIDQRLELLLQRTASRRRPSTEDAILDRIERQEQRVQAAEADPETALGL